MLTQNWETGSVCRGCGREIILGEEMIYNKHLSCAQGAALQRRQDSGEDGDVVAEAHRRLAAKGRIVLTSRQLRQLIALSGAEPVRRPDIGAGRVEWYGRLRGWTAERVAAGLTAAEVAGLWLDHLDIGRQPPIRHDDLDRIVSAIHDRAAVTAAT